ncbi:MAG: glycosyltransferase [Alistipes sp.]|nr:glycosyltransferase [Alistipes sp.]
MNSTPTISIIVPVFNAESYLSRCIDSLLAQTFKEFEIVMVNDGSTDSSGDICDNYAQQDDRIRVVHQPNQGVAAARQRGVDMAQGVFSIHVDPDDWVEPTMLEELYGKAIEQNADMTICDFMVDTSDKSSYLSQDINNCDAINCLNRLMYGKIHGSLCNKLIRTELYREFNIRFFEGINYCEDFLICAQLFLCGIDVAYLPKAFYHYDQVCNENSITRKYTKQTLNMRLQIFEILKGLLKERRCMLPQPKSLLSRLFRLYPKETRASLSQVVIGIAVECQYHRILTPREFAKTFGRYRKDFMQSDHALKFRMSLIKMASFGCFRSNKVE